MSKAIAKKGPDAEAHGSPRLPHEHDESSDSQKSTDQQSDNALIKQAHDDIVSGKLDTDLHGTPGLDKPTR